MSDAYTDAANESLGGWPSTLTHPIENTHYKATEFVCHCRECQADPPPMHLALAYFLIAVRAIYGKPIIITSGRRCPVHNTTVGGVRNSKHTTIPLMASDLTSDTPTSRKNTEILHMCAEMIQVLMYKVQGITMYVSPLQIKRKNYYFHVEWERGEFDDYTRNVGLPYDVRTED